jgi:Domain of unknown function (DUF4430)
MELSPSGTDEVGGPTHGGWVFPALLAAVLLVSTVIAMSSRSPENSANPTETAAWGPSAQPLGETVALEIDFGNGAKKEFAALPWRAGMTVADLMLQAREYRPGIDFRQHGAGAGGLLTSIDGLRNQGAGGRNWRYDVDGRHGEVSFCVQQLQPGMRVLWEFAAEE